MVIRDSRKGEIIHHQRFTEGRDNSPWLSEIHGRARSFTMVIRDSRKGEIIHHGYQRFTEGRGNSPWLSEIHGRGR